MQAAYYYKMMKHKTIKTKGWNVVFFISMALFLLEISYLKIFRAKAEIPYIEAFLIPPIVCSFCILIFIYNKLFRSVGVAPNNIIFKIFFCMLAFGFVFVWSALFYFFVL